MTHCFHDVEMLEAERDTKRVFRLEEKQYRFVCTWEAWRSVVLGRQLGGDGVRRGAFPRVKAEGPLGRCREGSGEGGRLVTGGGPEKYEDSLINTKKIPLFHFNTIISGFSYKYEKR